MRRWRWFFLATAGLFGYAGGSEWGVSHYRLKAARWAAVSYSCSRPAIVRLLYSHTAK